MVPSNRKRAPQLIQARTTSVHQIVVRVKLKQEVFAPCRTQASIWLHWIDCRWQFEIPDDRVRVIL